MILGAKRLFWCGALFVALPLLFGTVAQPRIGAQFQLHRTSS